LLLLLRSLGLWFGDALVVPVVLIAAASAVVWTRSDESDRTRWTGRPSEALSAAATAPVSPLRIVAGTVLVAGAIAGFVAATDAVVAVRDIGLALIAAVAGVALLFGPWLWRLWTALGSERRERIRQEERAELAAHLHDSVLQTLALIQRSSDQPRRMVALARRQERELRSWLYGTAGAPGHTGTLSDAVEAVVEEVEAVHDLAIETIVVGDAPVDDHVAALLAALREACVNVAKHAGVTEADVYVEVEDDDRRRVRPRPRPRVRRATPSPTTGRGSGARSSTGSSVTAAAPRSPPLPGRAPRSSCACPRPSSSTDHRSTPT
jgi:signal transduction histidine kinase